MSTALFAFIIFAATGYLLTFISAARGSATGRAVALTAGVIALPALAFLAFESVISAVLRCDESCNDNFGSATDWTQNVNAWQWDAQLFVVLAALLFSVPAIVLLTLRKERAARIASALTTVSVFMWAAIVLS